jgi:hypothetical protein
MGARVADDDRRLRAAWGLGSHRTEQFPHNTPIVLGGKLDGFPPSDRRRSSATGRSITSAAISV